jgi:hypothetical protein
LLLFMPAYATEGQRYEPSIAKHDGDENAASEKVAPPVGVKSYFRCPSYYSDYPRRKATR